MTELVAGIKFDQYDTGPDDLHIDSFQRYSACFVIFRTDGHTDRIDYDGLIGEFTAHEWEISEPINLYSPGDRAILIEALETAGIIQAD